MASMSSAPQTALSDGYGDASKSIGEETEDQIVRRFLKWCHAMANQTLPPSSSDHDDLVQEALIAIWRATQKADAEQGGANAPFLTNAAKWRLREVAVRQTWTGHSRSRGTKGKDVLRMSPASLDKVREEWGDLLEPADFDAVDALDKVVMAYHHGEIAQAIASLPPAHRAYVMKRFWGGKSDAEIAAERRVSSNQPSWEWKNKIAPALRESLGHLDPSHFQQDDLQSALKAAIETLVPSA